MRRLGLLNVVLLVYFIVSFTLPAAAKPLLSPPPALPEIHLLVDVSGSMKRTDPQNLRVKAINMFIYLIKQKALMQIQTFSTDTQLMMPLKPVDNKYQADYKQNSSKITSNGAWTDIDTALNQANKSWGLGKRNIILLTDGKVDLGDAFRTTQSKNKLMESTIKSLHQSGVTVFALGFSKEADKELLDNLAIKTSGLSKVVDDSKDLDSVLYSIFTAIIPVNGTPITEESDSSRIITVDKSIDALTLILKKTDHIAQVYLTDPKGNKKTIVELSNKDVSTINYLFVDINTPKPGKWVLTGPKQVVERAIILSDVNLISSFVSGSYFQGEELTLSCHFAQSGVTITTPALIENTSVTTQLASDNDHYSNVIPYQDAGIFKTELLINQPVGFYRLVLKAQNKFLSRELQFMIQIYELPIKISSSEARYDLTLVRTDLIKADSASVHLKADEPPFSLDAERHDNTWTMDLVTVCSNPSLLKKADVYFEAKTINDRPVRLRLSLPDNLCTNKAEFDSQVPSVQFPLLSVIPKIPELHEKIEKKSGSLMFIILLYSIIILLLILIMLTIWVFISGLKYGKIVEQLKKQLKTEISNEL